ncbi:DC1 - like 10 [Theobroma cacao]|nr:DC1 - like 10 [Theobroma cacao]
MQEVHLLLKDLQQEEKEKKKEKKELREKDEDEESSSDDEEDEETDDIDDEWTSEEEEDGDKEEMNEEEEEDEEKEGKNEQKMEEEERLEQNEESSDEEKEEEDDKLKETSEEEKKEFKNKEEKHEEEDEEKEGENEEHMEEEEGLEENEENSDEKKEEEDDKLKEMSEEEKKEFKNKEEKHEVEDEKKEGKNEEHMEEDEEGELEENEESSDEEDDESEDGNEEKNEKNEANQGKASTSINGTKKMSPHPLKPSKTPALEIEHFSHWHPLSLFHLTKKYEYENCKACRQELNGTVYICKTCEFPLFYYGLHKACAELPYELIHPFHSLHYLTLLPQFPYSESRCFLCDECGEFSGGFVYLCMDCLFKIDVKCAMLVASKTGCQKPKRRGKETKLLHFSHQHMLVLGNLGNKSAACCGCNLPILGLAYCCLDCLYFIHESCLRTLPQEIQHPFHPLHPLVAFHDPNDRKCHACKLEFRLSDFIRYGCWQCKLDLHLVCANSLRRVLKSSSHKHNLYYFGIDNQMILCLCP